ncbi:MAG: hypothetical protein MJ010_03565 [Paludibacteraceae bacterium]|nr:hypothetical protein [Paludibacteraceae bacterium]
MISYKLKNLRFCTFLTLLLIFVNCSFAAQYQLDNAGFENWGSSWNGKPQPNSWHLANVEQVGMKFNIGERSSKAHTGNYSTLCKGTEVGALGITAISPSWVTLGNPWAYLEGIKVGSATAGTDGGISFSARPDTMAVWVIRESAGNEDMNLLYYAWKGTSKGTQYKNKDNGCTSTTHYDEESDIRITTDANACKTAEYATQISEGWFKTKSTYNNWTLIKVPIKYYNNEIPTKANVILSASRYPDFRANSGQYTSSKLWVDDISLIYSSQIYDIRFNGLSYMKFNKDVYEYTRELEDGEPIPTITCYRSSRLLSGNEISIKNGVCDGAPTVITVNAEDGSSMSIYTIHFISHRDVNPEPENILINGEPLEGFNKKKFNYTNIELPYGTVENPEIEVVKGNDKQTVKIEPFTIPGTAKVTVYAENPDYNVTYNLTFTVQKLSDTTLKNIYVNGVAVKGFSPVKIMYPVNIPMGTTENPKVTYESAYPQGEQSVDIKTVQKTVAGRDSVVQIVVSAPGAAIPTTYELIYKEALSDYSYLQDLSVEGTTIDGFKPDSLNYIYTLPVGTKELPEVSYVKGESVQDVDVAYGGLDGTTKITVKAQNKLNTSIYRIQFPVIKSDVCILKNIYVGGVAVENFNPDVNDYIFEVPEGTVDVPEITWEQGDEFQTVQLKEAGMGEKSRIKVTAQNGATNEYHVLVKVVQSHISSLKDIKVGGVSIDNFDSSVLNYDIILPVGTKVLPEISYVKGDEKESVSVNKGGVNGTTEIRVIAEGGEVSVYTLNFSIKKSDNATLKNIFIDGEPLAEFASEIFEYNYIEREGAEGLHVITVDRDDSQLVHISNPFVYGISTITVTAEAGNTNTYTINFVRGGNTSTLSDIKIDGVTISGFAPDVYEYTYNLSFNAKKRPEIEVVKSDAYSVMTSSLPKLDGDAVFDITAEDGRSKSKYVVHFVKPVIKYNTLSDIKVDGTSILNFKPLKKKYVVKVKNTPSSVIPVGATASKTINNASHVRLETSDKDDLRGFTYDVYFHYEEDTIPNCDFTQWTKPKYTDVSTAVKPVGWNCPADVFGKQEVTWAAALVCLGRTAYAGYEISNIDNQIVAVRSDDYQCVLAGPLPAVLTLGTVSCSVGVASQSKVGFSGGITFRNTPETASIRYSYPNKDGGGALIAFRFFEGSKEINKDLMISNETTDFKVSNHPLKLDGKQLTKMNIAINPNGNIWSGLTAADKARIDLDYIHFLYSSKITAIRVNGVEASLTGTQATATIDEAYSGMPAIEITGEVEDQMYDISCGDEVDGVRTVNIKSYAEDMSFTCYTLEITRPNASIYLADIKLNGNTISGFSPEKLEYEVVLPSEKIKMPDLEAVAGDVNQIVSVSEVENGYEITVTYKNSQEKTVYRVLSTREKSDTDLAMIYLDGNQMDVFDPYVQKYNILKALGDNKMPEVSFDKRLESQKVEVTKTEDAIMLKVTGESGNQAEYSIDFVKKLYSDAHLEVIKINKEYIEGFEREKFNYDIMLPVGSDIEKVEVGYIRGDIGQTVSETREGNTVKLEVVSQDKSVINVYTVSLEVEKSTYTLLKDLMVGESSIEQFDKEVFDYTIVLPMGVKQMPEVKCVPGDAYQTIEYDVLEEQMQKKVIVTAQNGNSSVYTVKFEITLSDNAFLENIIVGDGRQLVPAFDSETFNYEVVLPFRSKTVPSVEPVPGDAGQTITPDYTEDVNDTSIITVLSEDEAVTNIYTIKFREADSDVSTLDMISYVINEDTIQIEDFEPEKYSYKVELPYGTTEAPEVEYLETDPATETVFKTTEEIEAEEYWQTSLVVTAQNGDMSKYIVDFVVVPDTENRLKNIWVFGKPIEGFDPDVLDYNIELKAYSDSSEIPCAKDISFEKFNEYEHVDNVVQQTRECIIIRVTSMSGDIRDYVINTTIKLSDNTQLDGIYYKGVSMKDFDPDVYEYTYKLPFGTAFVDDDLVTFDKHEESQMVKVQKSEQSAFDFMISVYSQEDIETGKEVPSGMYYISFVPDSFNPTSEPTADDVCITSTPDGEWKFTTRCKNVTIVLRDLNGGFMDVVNLPTVDPNCENICDANAKGYLYKGQLGKVVIYNFIYANKKRVLMGKFKCF